MKKIVILLVVLQLFFIPLYAQDRDQDYNALRKLGRGASNFFLGLTEIPRQMGIVREESGSVAGIFYGVPKGVFFAFGRMAIGIYEAVTFVMLPYEPIIEPEFVLSEGYNDLTPDEE